MKQVIFILLDGLSDTIASTKMGFLSALEEAGIAKRTRMPSALPSLSRPLYETLLTGKSPVTHGIFHNDDRRKSNQMSLFHKVAAAGGITAAAAYHWISELYLNGEANGYAHRFYSSENTDAPIHHGIFYYEDQYPDSHVFLDANALMRAHLPHFLFIHPMNIDDAGHRFGVLSEGYGHAVRRMDGILSRVIPEYMKAGYEIVITSDHGMGEDKAHGGNHPLERMVPFWYIGESALPLPELQTDVFEFLCHVLGLSS